MSTSITQLYGDLVGDPFVELNKINYRTFEDYACQLKRSVSHELFSFYTNGISHIRISRLKFANF